MRVPFFVQWKGRLPAGKDYEQPVAQIDILPTALAAAGIRTDPEWKLDGVNLLPHFTGQNAAPPHDALYWRFGNQMAVRAGDWKLVAARGSADGGPGARPRRPAAPAAPAAAPTPGLYNLAADVAEANDLTSQQPQKAAELRAAWDKWNADNQPPAWKAPNRAGQRRRQPAAAQQ